MKRYKLIAYDDDSLSDIVEESEADDAWLDTGTMQILLPNEVAKYVELTGILGIA